MAKLPEDRLECLVLCWLLSRDGESGARSGLKKALESLVDSGAGSKPQKRMDEAIDELRRKGAIHELRRGGLKLQPAGKKQVLSAIGVDGIPRSARDTRARWKWLKDTALVRVALGLEASMAGLKRVRATDDIKALILQRHFNLAPNPNLTLARVVNILIAVALGETKAIRKDTRTPILRRWLAQGSDEMTRGSEIPAAAAPKPEAQQAASAAASKPEAQQAPGAPITEPDSLARLGLSDFAQHVLAAAKRSPTGLRDGDKVFVSHVFRELQRSREADGMPLSDFKRRLVEANKKQLLRLSRADLVEGMAREDVTESEISFLSATFHFVRID